MRMENQESYNLIPVFLLALEAFFCTNILDRQLGISLPSILARLFASMSRKASGCMCLVHNLVPQTARACPYPANQRPVYSSPHWCQYTLPHRCSDTYLEDPATSRKVTTKDYATAPKPSSTPFAQGSCHRTPRPRIGYKTLKFGSHSSPDPV